MSVGPVGASYLTVSAEVGVSSKGAPAYSGQHWFSNPRRRAESAGQLLNVHMCGPAPSFLVHLVWGGA